MNIIFFPKAHTFIENLPVPLDARVNKMLDLLKNRGNELRMPFSKPVENGIFELRIVGAVQVRILYFFHKREAVVVHVFFKKTEKLSRRDIDYALLTRKSCIAGV